MRSRYNHRLMLLRTLGGLALEGASLTRPKPLLLLAYLTLNGPTSRRELAETLFRNAKDARDSLSTAFGHLRRVGAAESLPDDRLASCVESDATALLRDFDAYRYDAVFERYAGPFLDGIDVGLGLELEAWLFTTREAIARRVRSAGLHRARSAVGEGRWDDARRLVTGAMSLRGAPELEMDELAAVVPLVERLGLPEGGALRELAESYGLDLERPRPADAPRATSEGFASWVRNTAFIGRRHELRDLDDLLRRPDMRLVTLFGLGGVGKTRLAIRLAERLAAAAADRYPDGVIVVPLESVDRVEDVVPAIAARLALPRDAAVTIDALAEAIASWRALLLLDNVEQVADIATDVARLLAACPALQVVATSRMRLGLGIEHAVQVGGLSTAPGGDGPSEAARLFLERAERVGFPAEGARRDAHEIEALCVDLDGYPLGIELAASMTRALGVADIRASLTVALEMLDHGPVDAPTRHRAVRSVLEPTWRLLDEQERRVLERLSVFRTSFQLDAASAVAGASLALVLRLIDHAVLRTEGGSRGRFGFHPVMRAFLRERTPDDARADAARANRTFYAGLVDASVGRLERERAEVIERLDADLPDVIGAIQSFLDVGEPARAVATMRALVDDIDFFQARGAGGELIVLARQVAIEAEAMGDLAAAERLWTKAANAVRSLHGAPDEAARLYMRALDLAEHVGDVARQVMLHAILGAVLDERSPEAADRHMASAQALAQASGDELLTCEVLQRWGYVAARRKEWGRAREFGERAVETAERLLATHSTPSPRVASLLFFSLHNLGAAVYEEGAMAASLPIRMRALEVARERSNDLWTAYALDELAGLLHDLGRSPEALEHAAQALRLYEQLGAVDDHRVLAGEVAAWTSAMISETEAGAAARVATDRVPQET